MLLPHNNLWNQLPVELPLSSLDVINLTYCKVDAKSLFVTSIEEEMNEDAELRVDDSDVWSMSDTEMWNNGCVTIRASYLKQNLHQSL